MPELIDDHLRHLVAPREVTGILEPWIETGTEGAIWVIAEDGKTGYEGLVALERGDHLTVYGQDDAILFEGSIEPDETAGWSEYPCNPGHGQPAALGYWIHWTQAGWQPDDWAALFFHEPPLRARARQGPAYLIVSRRNGEVLESTRDRLRVLEYLEDMAEDEDGLDDVLLGLVGDGAALLDFVAGQEALSAWLSAQHQGVHEAHEAF